ncbi:MAG: type II toxin-antitoxin system PemK/MazF family toxin [bacterium]|nr:type II toxin-antitoxin system PemK/MazF family toxin [bacterium]
MENKKNFDRWNKTKKDLHTGKERLFFHVREVWFAHLGVNVGFEQDGSGEEFLRPVVILRKFNNEVCWILPLTRTDKKGPYYFRVSVGDKNSSVILSQIRLLDVKRLKYKIGHVEKKRFLKLKKSLKDLLS